MAEVYNSNMGEECDKYACHEADVDENTCSVIITYSGCSAHMFSVVHICSLTGECFATSHQNGVQVSCANGQLIEASGVGDAGFLTDALLVPQLKENLISEGKLALSGWKTMTFDCVNEIMEALDQNDAQTIYSVDTVYFPITEAANLSEGES